MKAVKLRLNGRRLPEVFERAVEGGLQPQRDVVVELLRALLRLVRLPLRAAPLRPLRLPVLRRLVVRRVLPLAGRPVLLPQLMVVEVLLELRLV